MLAAIALGNIPQWVSAVGGSLSLVLALSILIRDRARARAAQAAVIACWELKNPAVAVELDGSGKVKNWRSYTEADTVFLHNASDRPNTDVMLYSRCATKRELKSDPDRRSSRHSKLVGMEHGLQTYAYILTSQRYPER